MTKQLKHFILKKHNKARNKIALGKVPGYMPADRMPEMVLQEENNDDDREIMSFISDMERRA